MVVEFYGEPFLGYHNWTITFMIIMMTSILVLQLPESVHLLQNQTCQGRAGKLPTGRNCIQSQAGI